MAYPDAGNITTPGEMMVYVNVVMDNVFGVLFLFSVMTIFFISLKEYPTDQAFAVSATLTALFAVLFFFINLINGYFLILFIIFAIVGYFNLGE